MRFLVTYRVSVMVSLQKSYGDEAVSIKNFEETSKLAYSHGFERIYALENIDIRSVRPLHTVPKAEKKKQSVRPTIAEPLQLFLDFGAAFKEQVEPFLLSEPIQALGLSKYPEKCLLDNSKIYLRDLLEYDLRKLIYKGMGQGHIEEIREKLERYVEGKELVHTQFIDFASWIRSLTASSTIKKKLLICFEDFHLADLLPITPMEAMEVRRLTSEKRAEWKREAVEELATKREVVYHQVDILCNAFILPWMRYRQGIATHNEIQERLERVSESPEVASQALPFFTEFYGNPFVHRFYEVAPKLFCLDTKTKEAFETVSKAALTYFYKPGVQYRLDELATLVSRECARSWNGFPEGFVEKVLKLSPLFKTTKESTGFIKIKKLSIAQSPIDP